MEYINSVPDLICVQVKSRKMFPRHSQVKSLLTMVLRSVFVLQSIFYYIFTVNSKKCPPIKTILLVNFCLTCSALFFILTWTSFLALTMSTSILLQISIKSIVWILFYSKSYSNGFCILFGSQVMFWWKPELVSCQVETWLYFQGKIL